MRKNNFVLQTPGEINPGNISQLKKKVIWFNKIKQSSTLLTEKALCSIEIKLGSHITLLKFLISIP
jgi:hypothetical protein